MKLQNFTIIVCFCGEERAYLGEKFCRCIECKRWLVRNYELFRLALPEGGKER